MKYSKNFLRNQSISKRKKKYLGPENFNFNLVFNLVKKYFFKKKIVIAGYYPSNFEVDVLKFLEISEKKNYKIALPVIEISGDMCFKLWSFKDPLNINKYGIPEPKKQNRKIVPDLVMVPLVAFDKNMNRIGYGKGYYDRALRKIHKIKKKTIFLGIAFSFQMYKSIPINKYDFKLDYIFTERGIISSNQ